MNHKRKRSENARAGCLLCQPSMMSGWNKGKLGHAGFGKLRRLAAAAADAQERRPGLVRDLGGLDLLKLQGQVWLLRDCKT